MKRLFYSLLLLLFITQQLTILPGCANVIPPQGGPRDSIPPVLVKAEPGDSSRNFTGNRISFLFNEFVDVQNIQENLLISPLPKNQPLVESKLKTVTVRLKDSLEANTTYTFNFGNAIQDFTEGNPLKDFTYTFSTGRYIDSLELRGNVILAETGKPDSTLIVMLHTSSDDSAIINERPRYIAKADGKGNFIFRNLPPKTFYIYALKDDGGSKRYFKSSQLFAFADKPVTIQGKNDPVTLYAWSGTTAQQAPAATTTTPQGPRNKLQGNAEKRLRYQTSLIGNQQDLLSDLTISFEQALRSFDSTKIRLYTDSTFIPVQGYKIVKDSTSRQLHLTTNWKENTAYKLIMDKDFAEDSLGKKLLKTDTLAFITKKLADYGSLKIKFRSLDMSKNPVLVFLSAGIAVKTVPLASAEFSATLFLPGEYELRIFFDENKNGIWDTGRFFGKRKQPEMVKPVERKITVKPGWQNEFEIAL